MESISASVLRVFLGISFIIVLSTAYICNHRPLSNNEVRMILYKLIGFCIKRVFVGRKLGTAVPSEWKDLLYYFMI